MEFKISTWLKIAGFLVRILAKGCLKTGILLVSLLEDHRNIFKASSHHSAEDETELSAPGPFFLDVINFEAEVGRYALSISHDYSSITAESYKLGWMGLRSTPTTSACGCSSALTVRNFLQLSLSVNSPYSIAQMPVPVPISRTRKAVSAPGDNACFPSKVNLNRWF